MEDVTSLIFTVVNNEGGSLDLNEDNWYLTKLVSITKKDSTDPKFGPQLSWVFELQGEDFSYEKEGVTKQLVVFGQTSVILSNGPRISKLYEWYSKLTDTQPGEGESVDLKKFYGLYVDVMVKGKKGKKDPTKTWYTVDKIKLSAKNSKVPTKPAPISKPVSKPKVKETTFIRENPNNIQDPMDIPEMEVGTVSMDDDDITKDVF